MQTNSELILYQRENCPYCQIVRKKLSHVNQPVLLVPVEKNGADRKSLIELSGQQSVPVLQHGSRVIPGSERILDYLNEQFGSGDTAPMPANDLGLDATATGTFEEIVEKVVAALKTQGFGVQAEIDIQKTLKQKINVDMSRHLILGACNPQIAHQLLSREPDIGLLLPCNITIRETEDNTVIVKAVNPVKLLAMVGRDDLIPIAKEAKDRLIAALAAIGK